MAREAYQEAINRNPMYVEWVANYPHLGESPDALAPLSGR